MADSATSTALVIAGRYLASPAALRARPEGPIDALDTRSGRTAQVRIVFASDGWDDDSFTDAVTRWCALACSEICGVLDFGEHEGRRFLVVAPSLGMSIERWQATRRPGPADAARLALAFGRLAERIAAAGFPVDACDLGDCAVGPGPTPFLERPLLGSPAVNPILVGPRDGQRTLAAILRAAGGTGLGAPLEEWAGRAAAAGYESLAECLDDLERCGNEARESGDETELVGLAGLFDDDDDGHLARLVPLEPRTWPRRAAGGLGALALAVLAIVAIGHRPSGTPAAAPVPSRPRPVAVAPVTTSTPAKPKPRYPRHEHPAKRHPRVRRHRHPHGTNPSRSARATPPVPSPTSPPPPPPPSPPSTPPSTSAGSGAGDPLPDPGGTSTLPAP
jgi:hypothetical protein